MSERYKEILKFFKEFEKVVLADGIQISEDYLNCLLKANTYKEYLENLEKLGE